jgi:hypothetical protein
VYIVHYCYKPIHQNKYSPNLIENATLNTEMHHDAQEGFMIAGDQNRTGVSSLGSCNYTLLSSCICSNLAIDSATRTAHITPSQMQNQQLMPPDLVKVIEAWPKLPKAIKKAIACLIEEQ